MYWPDMTALLVGGARQCRRPDHIAHGKDMRHRRLVVLIDRNLAALVGGKAHGLEVQCRRYCRCDHWPTAADPDLMVRPDFRCSTTSSARASR